MKQFFLLFFLLSEGLLSGQTPRLVLPIGHTSNVGSVAFSPGGKYILTGSGDKTAILWDLKGHEICTFVGHSSKVTSVAFSPDGKKVLTGSEDGTAKLWNLSGKVIQTFSGHSAGITSIAFSPEGNKILTGSSFTAKLWDFQGQKLQTFRGHADIVSSVSFSPDGQQVLTGSWDQTAKLWNLSGEEIQTFSGHTREVNAVAFAPDGRKILTGSDDKTAKLWNLRGRELQTFAGHPGLIRSVSFSPDGKLLLIGCSWDFRGNKNLTIMWNLQGQNLQTFKGSATVAFSPDGQKVITSTPLILWDLQGRELQRLSGHASAVSSVAFSSDGNKILTGNDDKTAKLWNLQGRKLQTFKGHSSSIFSVAFSPNGQKILTGSADSTAKLWDILTGRELQTFRGHKDVVWAAAFSPDSQKVLTGSRGEAKLWDFQGRELHTFLEHAGMLTAFSPDGQKVLTSSGDTIVKLWDVQGHGLQIFTNGSYFTSVAFSPDGQQVLTGCMDNTAKLWDLQGRKIQTFMGHKTFVEPVAFSPGGQQVLTGSGDNNAKLWDIKTGRELRAFEGHADWVKSVAFSPDGQKILTGSWDNTAKLWSTDTGKELATLIAIDSADWIVIAPSGLFDASPGAMKLMYYVQRLEVIDLDQLKERYYEPGLLAKIMGFDKGALRNVANLDNVGLHPEIKASIDDNLLMIELAERNGGLGKLNLFINGKEVQEDINPKRLTTLVVDLNTSARYFRTDTANTVALLAYNAEGWLKSQSYELPYSIAITKGDKKTGGNTPNMPAHIKPSLYALVVGTADYSGNQLDLRFADQDALTMDQALRNSGSALFGARSTFVHVLTSTGKAPEELSNKTNITKAFSDIAAKATPSDILVVYFSGHGLAYGPAEKEQFYYLTKDIGSEDLSDPSVRDNYTVSSNELTQWLTAIPAQKQVMILDACNAGKVVESLVAVQKELSPSQIRALDRMKDRTGMFILTGSAADKVSYEASKYGQGLLTYSLLQGMSGLALTEDKRVDVMTLFQYARDLVPELAKGIGGIQTPVLAFPAGGASFDIGIVNAGVKIQVAQVKPVFIRNNFQDEKTFDDGLGLTKALSEHFQTLTARGAEAEIIYVDVSEYEGAYSLKGLYTVAGDVVTVRGRLFQGSKSKGEFLVTGKKSDVAGLAEAIVEKAQGMLK